MKTYDLITSRYLRLLIAGALIISLVAASNASFAAFTLKDEKEAGKEVYEKLKRRGYLAGDQRATRFISKIGNLLLEQGKTSPFKFTFSVINRSGINAFATPGGYVYIHRDLITTAENENQLAGVLAHEIAHVKSRHIAKIIEKSQKINIATLAALLAGAVMGGGGDATAAMASFSLAAATSLSLKYSREHEEEADRIGMSYLTSAGYDGRGMLDFLNIMKRYEYYSNIVPSYFMTHPGTNERIRYLDSLLHTKYTEKGRESIFGSFGRIKTLLILEDTDNSSILKHFQGNLKKNPRDADSLYGIAVAQQRLGRNDEALKNFKSALRLAPDDFDVLRDIGITYLNMGKTDMAVASLKEAHRIDDSDANTMIYLARALEASGDTLSALDMYKNLLEIHPENADVHQGLGMSYGKTGNEGESHFHFGIFFKEMNRIKSAVFHLKKAKRYFPEGSSRALEIKDLLEEIESGKTSPSK